MDTLECDLCGSSFKNKAGLGGHKATVHGYKKPLQPKLRDVLSGLDHRMSVLEGRVRSLEMAKMQQPLGAGTPPVEELFEGLVGFLECGKGYGPGSRPVCTPDVNARKDRFRQALGMK
jgi:hypothetical protein